MASPKSVLWAFYTLMQSLNNMTFTEAALRRNGRPSYFLSEKDPEPAQQTVGNEPLHLFYIFPPFSRQRIYSMATQ